jgi:adenosylcobinamide-phosphate synthase
MTMPDSTLSLQLMTALIVPVAFVLDASFGDPPNRLHPVALMGRIIGIGKMLNRPESPAIAFIAGLGVLIAGAALFAVPLWFLQIRTVAWGSSSGLSAAWIIPPAALLLKAAFSLRSLCRAGLETADLLDAGDLEGAHRCVAYHLVSRPVEGLSEGETASAAVESVAENLTDSFISPLFYFVPAGLAGAWFYRFVNTADAMIGYRTREYEYFGKAAAVTDSVLNWIPARIGGPLIALTAWSGGGSVSGALRIMRRDHGKTSSPNAGWTMAAMAGALGVRLVKHGAYTLNPEAPLPDSAMVRRSVRIVRIAAVVWLVCTTLLPAACVALGIRGLVR